ncbi:hypothetical protein PINS_up022060 [Pythium insidiosum]|nr:hypothetical protein PINS_up022060 [Pythium insidiosum]
MALKTNNIFHTLAEMRKRSFLGGFEFMPSPDAGYYKRLPERIGNDLTPEQFKRIEELGLLVDKDDQGILLQIFTKPARRRAPTVFIEIIEARRLHVRGRGQDGAGCGLRRLRQGQTSRSSSSRLRSTRRRSTCKSVSVGVSLLAVRVTDCVSF